jgi:hypothetical protein
VTYQKIDAETDRILLSNRSLPTHAKAVFSAFVQWTSDLEVKEHCPYCKGLLSVNNLDDRAWVVSCPCGRSSGNFRGS